MKRLVIVTALMAEAVPVVDYYRLKKQPKQGEYQLFRSGSGHDQASLDLLVCGIGGKHASRALKAYAWDYPPDVFTRWLNFGIAGGLEFDIGELVWVNHIGEVAIAVPGGITNQASARLVSLAQPNQDYQAGTLFDMEAEACLASIAENSQQFVPEHVFCAKVISDNPARGTQQIDKHWVSDIVRKKIKQLDQCINNIINSIE